MSALAQLHADVEQAKRLSMGGNNPPEALDLWNIVATDISAWMADNPVIQDEDSAREAKKLLDRGKTSAAEIEDERVKKVSPLNEQVAAINAAYKAIHNKGKEADKPGLLDKVVNELKARLGAFLRAEEARRKAEADRLAREAAEAERIAREAEAKEREAIANAQAGELGVDVTQVVVEADSRFNDFKKADREAARAERDSHVKIGGGWSRSLSLRSTETLRLDNYNKAITAIGPHPKIEEAILSAAREYRKEHGSLPAGVSAVIDRHV